MKKQMTLTEIEQGVKSKVYRVRSRGFLACIGRSDIPLEWLEQGINDKSWCVRCTAFKACAGRSDVPLEWLERGVNDVHVCVPTTAFSACIGRLDIPLEWLERGVKDEQPSVRRYAFSACIGRLDIPLEWLERGLDDVYYSIRTIVSKILFDRGYQFPLIRTIEPADKVYKQCENDVIVVAEIPKTAQVRGSIGDKCRASEAVVVGVIANVDGCVEPVSIWDNEITYKVGDRIVIDDFDYSNEECSTGFHFFNTLEEAMDYNFF